MIKTVVNKKKINGSLPIGWEIAQAKDVCDIIRGVSYKKVDSTQEAQKGYLPILRATNIQDNSLVLDKDLVYVPSNQVSENQRLKVGDIVIATSSGSKHLVGKTAQVKEKWCGAFGAFCAAIRSTVEIDYRYLGYFFNSPAYKDVIAAKAIGVNINNLRRSDIEELKIPIAPLNEQKRIAAEIEKQFSRLDEAVENLKRVKANLKRYKASVLKAAVEGKLTEEWRKKHPDVKPAEKLLERILADRHRKWEETELAKMKAKGKEPKNDKWKKKFKEPPQVDESLLPALPNGWAWSNLPQLGELNRGKSKHRPRNAPFLYGGPYPFVQTGDVRHATGIINQYSQTYSEEGLKQSRLWTKGTLCITIAANIADTALLGFDACFPDSIVGFIPENENVDVRVIEYFIRTTKEDLERYAPATAQKNINLAILSDVAVPFPPKEEQHVIIDEIEKCLTIAEGIESDIEQNMVRADRLRQSILKKAFSGCLFNNKFNNV